MATHKVRGGLEMATLEQVAKFRTSLVGVSAILGVAYRTLVPHTKKLKLHGKRGRLRYGVTDILKFQVAQHLYAAGFDTRTVIAALEKAIPLMVKMDKDHEAYFFLIPDGTGEVDIYQVSSERFPVALKVMMDSARVFHTFSLAALAREVVDRVSAFIDRKEYVPVSAAIKKAFAAVNREKLVEQP
jgi:hypothetical protein